MTALSLQQQQTAHHKPMRFVVVVTHQRHRTTHSYKTEQQAIQAYEYLASVQRTHNAVVELFDHGRFYRFSSTKKLTAITIVPGRVQ